MAGSALDGDERRSGAGAADDRAIASRVSCRWGGALDRADHCEGVTGEAIRDELDAQLRKHFRPEFLNRIDDVVIFDPLGKHELRDIVEIQLRALQKPVIDRRLTLEVTDAAKDRLTGHEPAFGARPLKRVILKQLQDPLAEEILRGDTIHIDVAESGEFSFTRHAATSPS